MATGGYWRKSLVKITIYVEGGGDTEAQKSRCRRAFIKFFEEAGFKGKMPTIIACGGRSIAYKDFCNAMKNMAEDSLPILLVDSESAMLASTKWAHLNKRIGDIWDKPENATENHVFLMVECMEAWFMADKEAIKDYFNIAALPAHSNIEAISKHDLMKRLELASKQKRGIGYSKGNDSFKILALINPYKVMDASPKAKELIEHLMRVLHK
jgi:hypothetical protein